MTKNYNKKKKKKEKRKQNTQWFKWFDFEPTSMGEDGEKLSLLLKEITTLVALKSQSPNFLDLGM